MGAGGSALRRRLEELERSASSRSRLCGPARREDKLPLLPGCRLGSGQNRRTLIVASVAAWGVFVSRQPGSRADVPQPSPPVRG